MQSLDYSLIHSFLIFVEEGSLVRAASKMGTTQPTLTRQLQLLESKMPFPIFETRGRQKALTVFGEKLHHKMKGHFHSISEDLQDLSNEIEKSQYWRIRIGARREFYKALVRDIEYPAQVEMQFISSRQIIKLMQEKQLDIALTHEILSSSDFIQKVIHKDRPSFLVSKSLCPKEPKNYLDFVQQYHHLPFIAYNRDFPFLNQLQKVVGPKLEFNIGFIIQDWTEVEELVHEKKYWSIVPSLFVQKNRNYWTLEIPNRKEYEYSVFLYYRRDYAKLPWFKKIIGQLCKSE